MLSWNQKRADEYIKQRNLAELIEGLDENGHITFTRVYVPALFFSAYSTDYFVILPRNGIDGYQIGWISWEIVSILWLRDNFPEYNQFRVILDSGTILICMGDIIGEGMASARQIIISNGDTSEYTRFDFDTFSNEGKILKAFMDVSIGKGSRIFDIKRKCWFIESSCVTPLLDGIKVLIAQGTLSGYFITDNRETIESFEEFFNPEAHGGFSPAPLKSKELLISDFYLLTGAGIECRDQSEFKRMYRKAALALHPDRNNGDGSKMAELNLVWSQLQEYL